MKIDPAKNDDKNRKTNYIKILLIILFVSTINANEVAPVALIGANISVPVISKNDTSIYNPYDLGLSLTFYRLKSKNNGFRFDQGVIAGFEVNEFTGRVYFGSNWLLFGFMHDSSLLLPLFLGVSAKAFLEVGKYNDYLLNVGGEAGGWLNLGILGQVGFFERYMIHTFSTRIEYGYRIPIVMDRKK